MTFHIIPQCYTVCSLLKVPLICNSIKILNRQFTHKLFCRSQTTEITQIIVYKLSQY